MGPPPCPCANGLRTGRSDRTCFRRLFRQQRFNGVVDAKRLRFAGMGLAEDSIAVSSPLIDQVERLPPAVAEPVPVGEIIVDHHRGLQSKLRGLCAHGGENALAFELRRVDADYWSPSACKRASSCRN